jgi:uncharacterized protein
MSQFLAVQIMEDRTMPHSNPSDVELRGLLMGARTIAMVGASSNHEKPSYRIFHQLQLAGYRVIPVNPRETDVLGEKAYPTLEAVPETIDIVDVFRRSEDTPAIAQSAVKIGAKVLWLQQGVSSEDAARIAEAGGLTVVMDLCIGATRTHLGLPAITQE